MSIVEMLRTVLQEQGYRPGPVGDDTVTFNYYGQPCALRLQSFGSQVIAELQCPLPRTAPTLQAAQQFSRQHPLARLGEQHGQTVLWLSSLLSERDVAPQTAIMMNLLDTYSAAVMFGAQPAEAQTLQTELQAIQTAQQAAPTAPLPVHRGTPATGAVPLVPDSAVLAPPPPVPPSAPVEPVAPTPPSSVGTVPAGWEEFWELMNERYHPLALALARLGVPVPSDVQVDLLQGRQVKGTAIMLWESTPQSVVICEPGQMIPEGYAGGTWLKHFNVDQVAASIQHNLRQVGLL